MLFESDVAKSDPFSRRRVDRPNGREDFQWWLKLLHFRERLNGSAGVQAIWEGIRARDIDLPTSGPHAKGLWMAFVSNCPLRQVIRHAADLHRKTGQVYEGLYEMVLDNVLLNKTGAIYPWHCELIRWCKPGPGVARRLASTLAECRMAEMNVALKKFKGIYLDIGQRDIYDVLIPRLYGRGAYQFAVKWHLLLVHHGDYPRKPASLKMPLKLAASPTTTRKSQLDMLQRTPPALASDDTGLAVDALTRENFSLCLGEIHNVEPKTKISDRFCARLYATDAFSIDFVSSGLAMFGIEEIGPLAFREIAVKAQTAPILLEAIERLRRLGVSITKCSFSESMIKAAQTSPADMFGAILDSDQHPDVYEDTILLKRLLGDYITARDWQGTRRILFILTLSSSDPVREGWKLLLGLFMEIADPNALGKLVDAMKLHDITLDNQTLSKLYTHHLRPRNPSKAPATHSLVDKFREHDDIVFVTNIMRLSVQCGTNIPAHRWHEVFRRLGMTGRLEELEGLVDWLVTWYSHPERVHLRLPPSPTTWSPPPCKTPAEATLNQLFPPSFQRALISWGFNTLATRRGYELIQPQHQHSASASTTASSPPLSPPWARPLRMLQHLRRHGVHVHTILVRKALRQRLWILFGVGHSNRLRNRLVRRKNPFGLGEFVTVADQLWGGKLFGLAEYAAAKEKERSEAGGKRGKERGGGGDEKMELLVRVFGERMWLNRRKRVSMTTTEFGEYLLGYEEQKTASKKLDREKC
ncbi:hypothetical protein BDY21DRAFT_291894 [Lineolata rhizophorae]|uniref:Pentatricopeptide repeat domain-containing protein n=1 Tax=Lineolata rhizophorae TaxID=578093 RepID=A0A6A6NRY9_9PEZI|nr:hypothetical protein BDY21DRAFT_291894 [Lineolata rhizophorae]